MAEENNNIPGRVLSLENDIANIGRTLTSISDKIDNNQMRNDTRFQAFQDAQLAQAQSRSSNSWQIIAAVGTGLISLAALAATIYSLTREPITEKFARQEKDIEKLQLNTVPVAQVKDIEDQANKNTDRINKISEDLAATKANQQNDQKAIESVSTIQREIATKYALNSRVDLLSTRVQTIFDKNFALPSISTLQGVAPASPPR